MGKPPGSHLEGCVLRLDRLLEELRWEEEEVKEEASLILLRLDHNLLRPASRRQTSPRPISVPRSADWFLVAQDGAANARHPLNHRARRLPPCLEHRPLPCPILFFALLLLVDEYANLVSFREEEVKGELHRPGLVPRLGRVARLTQTPA